MSYKAFCDFSLNKIGEKEPSGLIIPPVARIWHLIDPKFVEFFHLAFSKLPVWAIDDATTANVISFSRNRSDPKRPLDTCHAQPAS
jgi:hypothetical protein